MAKPLKSLINSCIGLSCEREASVEENMNDLKLEAYVDEGISTNANISQIVAHVSDLQPDSARNGEMDPIQHSTPLHEDQLPMDFHPNFHNGNNMTHNVLYSTSGVAAIDVGRSTESCSDMAPLHRNAVVGIRQGDEPNTVYGTSNMPLVSSAEMQPCLQTGVPCESSTNSSHWCPACRVKVQVEVECIPAVQRDSASPKSLVNKKSLWSFFQSKKAKHKDKNTKDADRNSISLMLNNKVKLNKASELEPTHSPVTVGCSCCSLPISHSHNDCEYKPRDCEASLAECSLHHSFVGGHHSCSGLMLMDANGERQNAMDRLDEHSHTIVPIAESWPRNALNFSAIDLHVYLAGTLQVERCLRHNLTVHPEAVHTQVNYIHCLVPDLLSITNCGFYWGKMDRYEAEQLIENKPEGTFLLRDSAQEDYLFSVSFCRHERSLHARIEQSNCKFSFDPLDPGVFSSDTVCGLLEFYKDPSCCMFYDPVLTNPLPRTFPFPLQHLCRATICSQITYNGIGQLCLPKTLKNYLKEYHYKQRVSVKHWD